MDLCSICGQETSNITQEQHCSWNYPVSFPSCLQSREPIRANQHTRQACCNKMRLATVVAMFAEWPCLCLLPPWQEQCGSLIRINERDAGPWRRNCRWSTQGLPAESKQSEKRGGRMERKGLRREKHRARNRGREEERKRDRETASQGLPRFFFVFFTPFPRSRSLCYLPPHTPISKLQV